MDDDRGQTTPLIALLVAVAAAAMLLVAALGERASVHARVATAADAAALAVAATGDPASAHEVADANGARVLSVELGPPVVVTVEIDGVAGTAAASWVSPRGAPVPD